MLADVDRSFSNLAIVLSAHSLVWRYRNPEHVIRLQDVLAHRINASVVKAWFQYRCERKTRYEMLAPQALAEIGVVAVKKQQPWAFLGNEFERRVVDRLGRQVIRPAGAKAGLWEAVARAFLTGSRPEAFAYQLDLGSGSAPSALSLPPGVVVGSTMADLVRLDERDGRSIFTVIDVKATRRATSFHKAQVAFYAILLEAMLQQLGAAGRVSDLGEIWRIPDGGDATGGEHAVEAFALGPYRRMVLGFCVEDLPRILAPRIASGVNQTFFHVYFKCEECQFLAKHCAEAVSPPRRAGDRDVSAVAGVSHEAKRALLRMGLGTVDALAGATGLSARTGLGWSLQRRADLLVSRASSLQGESVARTAERHSLLMPPRVDVGIYLLADFDPIGDRLATIACLVDKGGRSPSSSVVRVLRSGDRAAEADALIDVFRSVIAALADIDALNARVGSGSEHAIYAHIFIYETAEAVAIQGAIARHLGDDRVRQGLLDMVRLFPPEDVVPEPEFRGIHHLPATAVRMVVEQLFALPVTVSYDLAQVTQALEAAGRLSGAYRPGDAFRRPFSSLLSIDVIKEMEGRGGWPLVSATEVDVVQRLAALQGVAAFLIEASAQQALGPDGPMLRLSKRPFRFWQTFNPVGATDLDVLQAFELIESRAGLLATMVDLARPLDRRVDAGRCMAGLRMVGRPRPGAPRARFLFDLPRSGRTAEVGPDSFGLVLTNGDQGVLLDYTSWADIECSIVPEWSSAAGPGQVEVTMRGSAFRSPSFQAMYDQSREDGLWVIDQVFKDVNTDRIATFLQHLATGDAA